MSIVYPIKLFISIFDNKILLYTDNSDKTDRHNIAEILLKVALNTINHKQKLQTYTDNIEQVTFNLMTSVTGMYPMIKKVGESMSFLSIFVGLEGTSEELGLKGQNIWAYTG